MTDSSTLPGLDALRAGHSAASLAPWRGRRVGLITNHTGRTMDGRPALDVLRDLDINVQALFAPEHGASGTREGRIESTTAAEGLPVYSLHGETYRPTATMLQGLDAMIYDLQDVGARFYTYATTLAYSLEECSRHSLTLIVLDRPNPVGGDLVEGPGLSEECRSFVGHLRVPVRHGLTVGELAQLHRADEGLDCSLLIIPTINWQRPMRWPDTGLPWVAPSPNLPDFTAAAWYPGLCLLEYSGVAVGRGTAAPFQIVGAPWLDPERVLDAMASWPPVGRYAIAGQATEFVPTRAIFAGEPCRGIRFTTPDSPVHGPEFPAALGLALLATLHRVHPLEFDETRLRACLRLLGSPPVLGDLLANDLTGALALARADADTFRTRRAPFLLYR